MKEIIKFLIIGIVQGLGEVLPISSSAHLLIFEEILNINNNNLTLEIFLHLASLIAILFFLRKRLVKLVLGFFKYLFRKQQEYYLEFKLGCFLILSTIPIVLITIIFKDWIMLVSSNIKFIGLFLVINGFLLLIITNNTGNKKIEKMSYFDALIIGIFQCIGIFPGISRSGSCLLGASIRKMEKETAAEYAFLMFIPTVLGATILEFNNFGNLIVKDNLWMYLVTFFVTCIVTYLAFEVLLNIIKKGKIKYFGYYCIVIGLISFWYGFVK